MSPETPAPPIAPDDAPLDAVLEEGEAAQVLLVRIGTRRYAVPLGDLLEVVRARPAARLPGAASWVLGLVPVRGHLLPVGDLERLAAPADGSGAAPWFLVVERGPRRAAFGVSAVDGVHVVASDGPSIDGASPLPCRGAARLLSQAAGGAQGAPDAVDVLDVGALLDELLVGE